MKFLRRLFSRTAIVAFALLLQLIIYIYISEWLVSDYFYVSIAFDILSAVFILVVINRDMSASYKVPWIIVILVFPIMGVVLYLLLGHPRPNGKIRRKLREIHDKTEKYLIPDGNIVNSLSYENEIAAGQAKYLISSAKMPLYVNSDVQYFSTGLEAFEKMKEVLKNAQKFILMEYFIIEEKGMWEEILSILKKKAALGVKVKVMYDDFGCAGKLRHNYDKILRSYGIKCVKFNKLTPLISAVHNNRDHRKITVVDGLYAFTGGFNLCDEYVDRTRPFGYWKDSAVMITGEAVRSFTVMFMRQYVTQADEKVDIDKFLGDEVKVKGSGYILPFGDGPAPIYESNIAEQTYLNIINSAKRYVYITTPYYIVDYHITKAIKAAAMRGVDVRIIVPHIPDKKIVNIMTKSSYEGLIKSGVKIYEFTPGFIHAKSFVCDDSIAVVGTINLDYRSLVHHYECGVWMYNTSAVNDIKSDYDNTLYVSEFIDSKKGKLKWYQKIVASILMLFAPLM